MLVFYIYCSNNKTIPPGKLSFPHPDHNLKKGTWLSHKQHLPWPIVAQCRHVWLRTACCAFLVSWPSTCVLVTSQQSRYTVQLQTTLPRPSHLSHVTYHRLIAMTQCQMGHGLTMVCICGKKSDEEPGRHHRHTSLSSGPVRTAAGACSQLWPWGRGATWRQVELQHSQAEESWKPVTLQLCSLPGPRAAAPQKC